MDNLEIFKDEIANAIQSQRYTLAHASCHLSDRKTWPYEGTRDEGVCCSC